MSSAEWELQFTLHTTGKERHREDGPVPRYKDSNLFGEEIHTDGDVGYL